MSELLAIGRNQITTKEEIFFESIFQNIKRFITTSQLVPIEATSSLLVPTIVTTTLDDNDDFKRTILLFPPLSPRGRFLIHKCAENFDLLKSISIGSGEKRRVVIFNPHHHHHHHHRKRSHVDDQKGNAKHTSSVSRRRRMSTPSPLDSPKNVAKKPDMARYVPRHRRNESPHSEATKSKQEKEKTQKRVTTKKIKKRIDDLSQEDLSQEVLSQEVLSQEVLSQKDLSQKDLSQEDLSQKDLSQKDLSQKDLSQEDLSQEDLSQKDFSQENLSQETTTNNSPALPNNVTPLKVCSQMSHLDLPLKKTENILYHANIAAEKMSNDILIKSFEDLKNGRLKSRRKNKSYSYQKVRLDRILPEIATNFVNLAIENAMQLLKSIKKESFPLVENLDVEHSKQRERKALVEMDCKPSEDLVVDVKDLLEDRKVEEKVHSIPGIPANKSLTKPPEHSVLPDDKETKSQSQISKKKSKSKKPKKLKKGSRKQQKDDKNDERTAEIENAVPEEESKLPVATTCEVEDCKDTNDALDDWDSNWTEDGECLSEEVKKELSLLTGIKNPKIEQAEGIDYLNFEPTKNIELDQGEFGHIIEIFDFSSYLKTQDIFSALSSAGIKDYNLTWVDDTHVLAIFASQAAAHSAMKVYVPMLQMRQVVNGSRSSKSKARELKDVLLPYKKRPESTGMVARNLVAGALGIRTTVSREQRQKEKQMLSEAREKRRQKKQAQNDIWENP